MDSATSSNSGIVGGCDHFARGKLHDSLHQILQIAYRETLIEPGPANFGGKTLILYPTWVSNFTRMAEREI